VLAVQPVLAVRQVLPVVTVAQVVTRHLAPSSLLLAVVAVQVVLFQLPLLAVAVVVGLAEPVVTDLLPVVPEACLRQLQTEPVARA
jgi:hypothetical protein